MEIELFILYALCSMLSVIAICHIVRHLIRYIRYLMHYKNIKSLKVGEIYYTKYDSWLTSLAEVVYINDRYVKVKQLPISFEYINEKGESDRYPEWIITEFVYTKKEFFMKEKYQHISNIHKDTNIDHMAKELIECYL